MLTASKHLAWPVVNQHAEDVAILCSVRSALVVAPHVKLHHLRRLDDRLAAHLDGLAVAGEHGWTICESALESAGAGEVFTAAVSSIENRSPAALEKLFALAQPAPDSQSGLLSAFGWVSAHFLEGTIKNLLASASPFQRQVGIAACAMHRIDPGKPLDGAARDDDPMLRARGLRVAGECGRRDLSAVCAKTLTDDDASCRFWAARSAVILGQRDAAIGTLRSAVSHPGPQRGRALQCLLKVIDVESAHVFLKSLAQDAANTRLVLQGAGIAGDPHYVPWLIKQMADEKLMRLAGESFSLITGIDLAWLDLDRKPPEGADFGPSDNPEDDNVDMDPDDGLPWPDETKVQAWWSANGSRFQSGSRYFMGEPVNADNCRRVLREGYQRQRIAAALYLSLLQPGTQLFPTSAPAWRQQRWLSTLA